MHISLLLVFLLSFLIIFLLIVLIFALFEISKFFLKPKINKNWIHLHKHAPRVDIADTGHIKIEKIRNAKYKKNEKNYEVNWLDKEYHLNDLKGAWIIVDNFGFFQSHIILSFKFVDENKKEDYLAVSYELRKDSHWTYNFWKVFFKNHEAFYILTLEEDTIYLRTNIRKDKNVHMMELNIDEEKAKELFIQISKDINIYNRKAHFYSIFYRNCLTQVFKHFSKIGIFNYFRIELLNVLYFLYRKKVFKNLDNLSFIEFKEKTDIHYKAHKLKADGDFDILLRR
jgi:hypothetical protein